MLGSILGVMVVNATDEIFIDAPADDVYRALLTFGKDAAWWPGAKTSSEGKRLRVTLPVGRVSRLSFEANIDNVRPDEGLTWWMDVGELNGRGEWWLEPFKDGTIVHYYLEVEQNGRRKIDDAVERHRFAIRRGMNALKDEMEGR
ncbi:MAG: hypothetical protein NVSMB57_03310 [Actinomycetota bacterium]